MKINWTSKLLLFALFGLLIFLGQQKVRQYILQKAIEKEKQNLVSQKAALEGKNEELKTTLSYLNSSDHKELIARQQLNLQKEGELVYNFTQKPSNVGGAFTQAGKQATNFEKWINYFLNKHGK